MISLASSLNLILTSLRERSEHAKILQFAGGFHIFFAYFRRHGNSVLKVSASYYVKIGHGRAFCQLIIGSITG